MSLAIDLEPLAMSPIGLMLLGALLVWYGVAGWRRARRNRVRIDPKDRS